MLPSHLLVLMSLLALRSKDSHLFLVLSHKDALLARKFGAVVKEMFSILL